jgi:hypothetical protein
MKKIRLPLLIALMFLLEACDNSDLLDPYFVQEARILAVKIEDPEAMPGDTVSMRMLVGGKAVEQDMVNLVEWAIDDAELEPIGVSNYNQEFSYQIPMDFLGDNAWYDLPIYASIKVGQKNLNALKLFRLSQNPTSRNPVISSVQVRYLNADQTILETVANGETFTLPKNVENAAFTAITEELAAGENDKLVYRWYISVSKTNDSKLYVQTDEDKIESLLEDGVNASELFPSVVFSLKGEDNDNAFQTGVYDVYLIVRDNAANPQSTADERHGTDFIYFTLVCE